MFDTGLAFLPVMPRRWIDAKPGKSRTRPLVRSTTEQIIFPHIFHSDIRDISRRRNVFLSLRGLGVISDPKQFIADLFYSEHSEKCH